MPHASNPRESIQRIAAAKAAAALLIVWLFAAGGILVARSMRPTAEKVIALLRQWDLSTLTPDQREQAIEEAAASVNRLDLHQARQVQQNRAIFLFYRPLTPREKERFAELIVPTGLRRILDACLKLPREQRSAFLERAVYHAALDLTIAEPPIDPKALHHIERQALRAYVEDLSLAERFELEPQLKELQGYVQAGE